MWGAVKTRSPSFSLSERGGSCGLCKGEILGAWTLGHMHTQLQSTTHSFPQMNWATERTHTHTHIYINKCSGSQRRSSFTQNPLQEQPVLFVAQKPVIGWILKVNIRLQEWTLHSGSEHIVIHARGWKCTKMGFSELNLPDVKQTLAFQLFRAELDISYILKRVGSHWLIIKI